MVFQTAAIRRQQAAEVAEERRRNLLSSSTGICDGFETDEDAEPPEIVEVSGRDPAKKNAERLRGAYQRIESELHRIAYQKLAPDTGQFCEDGPFLLRSDKGRWKLIDSQDSKGKGYAYNPDEKMLGPWSCYDGKELGYNVDEALSVTAIPLGFGPCSPPNPYLEETILEEGPAKGTIVRAFTYVDESQVRKASPRVDIRLRGQPPSYKTKQSFMQCRFRWLDDETKELIWNRYRGLMARLVHHLESTFFYFVAAKHGCSTVWYKRLGEDLLPLQDGDPFGDEAGAQAAAAAAAEVAAELSAKPRTAAAGAPPPKRRRTSAGGSGLPDLAAGEEEAPDTCGVDMPSLRAEPGAGGDEAPAEFGGGAGASVPAAVAADPRELPGQRCRKSRAWRRGALRDPGGGQVVVEKLTPPRPPPPRPRLSPPPQRPSPPRPRPRLSPRPVRLSPPLHRVRRLSPPRPPTPPARPRSPERSQQAPPAAPPPPEKVAPPAAPPRDIGAEIEAVAPAGAKAIIIDVDAEKIIPEPRKIVSDPEYNPTFSLEPYLQVLDAHVATRGATSSELRLAGTELWELHDRLFPKKEGLSVSKTIDAGLVGSDGAKWWLAFFVGEQLRLHAKDQAEDEATKNLLLRAFHIYRGLAAARTAPAVQVAAYLRQAQIRTALDRLCNSTERARSAEDDHSRARRLLAVMRDFMAELQAAWSLPAPPPESPVKDPPPPPSAPAPPPAPPAEPKVKVVGFGDLQPKLQPPWCLEALVVDKVFFSTGTGFRATLKDTAGNRLPAFFFREAARVHDTAVRSGATVLLTAKGRGTYVRQADSRFGTGFQLVVGPESALTCRGGVEPRAGSLASLPTDCRLDEVFGLVLDPGQLAIARNGEAYRRVLLTDESRSVIPWTVFRTEATDVPDTLARGMVVEISMSLVATWGGSKQLKHGRLSILPAVHPRAMELGRWQGI